MRIFPSKRGWKRLGIALAILVGIALAANGVVAWWVDYQFQSRVAAIRVAGDPASIADLAPSSDSGGKKRRCDPRSTSAATR